jgi:hypothetical protein
MKVFDSPNSNKLTTINSKDKEVNQKIYATGVLSPKHTQNRGNRKIHGKYMLQAYGLLRI